MRWGLYDTNMKTGSYHIYTLLLDERVKASHKLTDIVLVATSHCVFFNLLNMATRDKIKKKKELISALAFM